MARLHEYQGKQLLRKYGISTPRGGPATTPDQAREVAASLAVGSALPTTPAVVKAQTWVTGRAGLGLIRRADTPEEAAAAAQAMLGQGIKSFIVGSVLVEEWLEIRREFYAGLVIDDARQAPVMIFSSRGGTGIEEVGKQYPDAIAAQVVDVRLGLRDYEARDLVRRTGIHGRLQVELGALLSQLYRLAAGCEARAAEINPIAETNKGRLVAVDCRITIDDNAVFRHPELGIEVAREFDRPPTELERIAWSAERDDYRGTFYFVQLEQDFRHGDGVIGFHGEGGGGSMLSMDAVLDRGYRLADFVDTSGNPPASKVYRAAKIILAQRGIDGYFMSGCGVASQEQYHSARGLAKAFLEEPLMVPAVIRLGGNAEEQAIEILNRLRPLLPVPIEAYGKADPPEFCAGRLQALLESYTPVVHDVPSLLSAGEATQPYTFRTVTGGTVELDHAVCRECESKICVEACAGRILEQKDSVPVLSIPPDEARQGKCIECLACEIECYFLGKRGGRIHLPIQGLEAYYTVERDGHPDR